MTFFVCSIIWQITIERLLNKRQWLTAGLNIRLGTLRKRLHGIVGVAEQRGDKIYRGRVGRAR